VTIIIISAFFKEKLIASSTRDGILSETTFMNPPTQNKKTETNEQGNSKKKRKPKEAKSIQYVYGNRWNRNKLQDAK
jgi:hypothetical protein